MLVVHEVKPDRMCARCQSQGYAVGACPDCDVCIVDPDVNVALAVQC